MRSRSSALCRRPGDEIGGFDLEEWRRSVFSLPAFSLAFLF